ncbi:uncharacterized protein EHS24_005291 [Apiotrichum porosum]|uniref:Uncharacterized protein n=1 Tax=Apiotrichum porosum TaxID=105984 RepID=A0A427XCZ5_9TREE|nr:uncharacterized protein EHS24_005291 [Apiotrichum porosum]RSH76715.1 hypothetical protein EHS24_005291 [Apiotrichum porosum]
MTNSRPYSSSSTGSKSSFSSSTSTAFSTLSTSSYPFWTATGTRDTRRFSPRLRDLLMTLREHDIKAIEWGLGLDSSMGAPVHVSNHFIILDLAYVSFIPELGIWQPDPIEAFRSYLHPVCMREGSLYHPDIMSLVSWMSNFIIYATCGVKYIPKPTTEDECDNDDPAWEREGLARLDSVPWGERQWLEPVLRSLVKGEVSYEIFTKDW